MKTEIEYRGNCYGFVYAGETRMSFGTHDGEIRLSPTRWGSPTKPEFKAIVTAMEKEFPGKTILTD